jgi:hypothetical protein
LARKKPVPPVVESLVAGGSHKSKAQPTKGDESNKKKAAKWSPGREVDPDDPLPGLVRRVFDRILCHAINRSLGRGIAPDRYAEICREFIDFMEKQTQEYIEAVEPAYIVAVQCKSFDEFLDAVSVQRKCCYLALLPVLGDIDPLLKDAPPEWAGCFYDLVRELRAPPKLLLEVLWRGRWRHAKFWGREFDALRLEISNARKRSKRAEAKDRKRESPLEYLDGTFHQMHDVESQKRAMGAMESALYQAWGKMQDDPDNPPRLTLKKGTTWEAVGKRAGLKPRERKLLVKRALGEARRNRDNQAAWKMLCSRYPDLRDVLQAALQEEKLVGRFAHPLVLERINGRNISYTFFGLDGV